MLLEENRRLREALERIASPDQPLQFGSAAHLREMARAALAGSVSDKDREPDEVCEHCGGRGVYAHENPATGSRNAVACPRCKGSGARSVSDNPKDQK